MKLTEDKSDDKDEEIFSNGYDNDPTKYKLEQARFRNWLSHWAKIETRDYIYNMQNKTNKYSKKPKKQKSQIIGNEKNDS